MASTPRIKNPELVSFTGVTFPCGKQRAYTCAKIDSERNTGSLLFPLLFMSSSHVTPRRAVSMENRCPIAAKGRGEPMAPAFRAPDAASPELPPPTSMRSLGRQRPAWVQNGSLCLFLAPVEEQIILMKGIYSPN